MPVLIPLAITLTAGLSLRLQTTSGGRMRLLTLLPGAIGLRGNKPFSIINHHV